MIQKTLNFDDVTEEDTKEHNPFWPPIFNHPYRIKIAGLSGSEKNKFII